MGGYAPHTRAGLIALIAMRRITAEKIRREKLAKAKDPAEAAPLFEADRRQKKAGWFRR
ncbi:hypothetical protein [Brevundimonas sp.]|uniref:hypothetical protein n=1 Tax=Brevundimonas sp. TaxID=1871086 RepID=UPI0025B899FB|nr:hypothetical protein [Brevundimonas sp.]